MQKENIEKTFEELFFDRPETQLIIAERKIKSLEKEKLELSEEIDGLKNRIIEIKNILKKIGIDL